MPPPILLPDAAPLMPAARLAAASLLVPLLAGCGPGGPPVTPVAAAATGGAVTVAGDAGPAARPFDPGEPVEATEEVGWPTFRGPNRTGLAPAADPPVKWSESRNVAWSSDVPGRGHSSPVVAGGRVFLCSAVPEEAAQLLLCYDAATGEQLWEEVVSLGGLPTDGMHPESTHASGTPAVAGGRVFVAFLHDGAVWASAYSVDGDKLWDEVELGAFRPVFGYAVSPVVYGDAVLVGGDNAGPGFLTALDAATGDVRWRTPRDAQISFNTPLPATLNGRDTLILCGNGAMDACDPADGTKLWSVPGLTETVSGSPAADRVTIDGETVDVVVASGGYPGSETLAVVPPPGGAGEPRVLWRNGTKAYVPSAAMHDGLVFLTHDDGRTWCYDAATGEEKWKTRLSEPVFRASPVVVTGGTPRVYLPSSKGLTTVYAATGERFEKLAENRLGDETYASPAVVGDRLYLRAATGTGADRQDRLYCIAAE